MVQNLVAVFSTLIGLAGLVLSYAGHRQKVRQEAQESARRAEELRSIEREREQEREAGARRERERLQASMISGHIAQTPSALDDSWVVPQIVIHNGFNQSIRDVRVFRCGEVIRELPHVGTGYEYLRLPPTRIPDEHSGQITIEFTDVAGIRWRREGYGALQRARQGTEGSETWAWEDPEFPSSKEPRRPRSRPQLLRPGSRGRPRARLSARAGTRRALSRRIGKWRFGAMAAARGSRPGRRCAGVWGSSGWPSCWVPWCSSPEASGGSSRTSAALRKFVEGVRLS
ncbi:hypothetical protein, partial [Streptomyces sp. T21Q-yed]|uniref:hypothetical protein n=1 Tax=Streptomyces sp. T21Q-yed TaxID=3018441 RepID=UPI0023DF3400